MGTMQAPIDPNGATVLLQYAGVVDQGGRPVVLGKGAFGTVYRAIKRDDPDGRAFAVKVMTKAWEEISSPEQRLIQSEIKTLFKCKHTHIIGILPNIVRKFFLYA